MTSFNTAKTKKGYSKPLLLWLLNLHEDGFEFFMTIFKCFSENTHRNHGTSLRIGDGIMMVLCQVVAQILGHCLQLMVL